MVPVTISDSAQSKTQSLIPMRHFSKQEEHDMWQFLLKEIVDPLTGLIERDRIRAKGLTFWEKYRLEVSPRRSATSLRKRFSMPNFPTPQSMNFDLDSRVKLHYALGIPVDEFQLNEFLENADVDLDEYSCIVRYKDRRPGGLELRQFVRHRRRRRDRAEGPDAKMCKLDFSFLTNAKQEFSENDVKLEPLEPLDDLTSASGSRLSPESTNTDDNYDREEMNQETVPNFLSTLNSTMLDVFKQLAPEENETSNKKAINLVSSSSKGNDKKLREATGIRMTTYLKSLDSLVSAFDSAELEGIQLKIEAALNKSRQENNTIPMSKVKMMMEATLAMMGF